MAPCISILIPAHNASKWIAETIQSALSQTWTRKEIIVVDDGSTDDTLAIARRFASPDIRVVSQHKQGASAARNTAFAHSQGDYIQWLDADDVLAPDKIARQIQALRPWESRRTLLSCAWGRFTTRPERATFTPTPLWRDLSPVEWMLRKMEQNIYMQTTAWLVSRELAEAAGPWDARLWVDDDGEYFTRVILASDSVRFVPEARTYYRESGSDSLSQIGLSKRKREAQLLSLELSVARLRAVEESERVRAACMQALQMYLNYILPEEQDLLKRAEALATSLGGRLAPPVVSWRHALLKAFLGATAAKRTQLHYRELKSALKSNLSA
ncbi:MAG: glycosyltransferase family 2 protein [Verrucomicrobiota bacterium]